MKTTLALLVLASAVLDGCVAVPVEPGPVVYAAPPPPPVVVVRPYRYYGYYRTPYWRYHGWR